MSSTEDVEDKESLVGGAECVGTWYLYGEHWYSRPDPMTKERVSWWEAGITRHQCREQLVMLEMIKKYKEDGDWRDGRGRYRDQSDEICGSIADDIPKIINTFIQKETLFYQTLCQVTEYTSEVIMGR